MTQLIQVRCTNCLLAFDIALLREVELACCPHCGTKLKFDRIGVGFATSIYKGNDPVPSARELVETYVKTTGEHTAENNVVTDQEVPEWKKFIPGKLGKAGDQISYKLDDAIYLISSQNKRYYNMDKLKDLYARLDSSKLAALNSQSEVLDEAWLNPYREIRYLAARLHAVADLTSTVPYETPQEANEAIDRLGELYQPYLKPVEA